MHLHSVLHINRWRYSLFPVSLSLFLLFLAIYTFSHMMWFRLTQLNCDCADDRDEGTHRTNTFLPLYYCLQFIYCLFHSLDPNEANISINRMMMHWKKERNFSKRFFFLRFDWFALCACARLCSVWTSERVRFCLFIFPCAFLLWYFVRPCVDIISQMPQCILS